jgi:hypothetical protein
MKNPELFVNKFFFLFYYMHTIQYENFNEEAPDEYR